MPKKKIVFDPIGEGRRRETDRQKLRRKKSDQERASLESCNQTRNSKKSEDGRGESSPSCFAEEEYIVFCFRDDGDIQMVKEKRSSEASHDQINHANQRSRSVNHTVSSSNHFSNDFVFYFFGTLKFLIDRLQIFLIFI